MVSPERVARACVSAAIGDRRPRRQVHVGPVNLPAVAGFRMAPALYDALAPALVSRVVLRGRAVEDDDGNVVAARPEREAERGGWTWWGSRRGRKGEVDTTPTLGRSAPTSCTPSGGRYPLVDTRS